MEICGEEDIVDVKDDVDIIQSKYDEVRAILREKLNRLDEAFRSITSDVRAFLLFSAHSRLVYINLNIITDQILFFLLPKKKKIINKHRTIYIHHHRIIII